MKSKLNPVGDIENKDTVCCFWYFDDVACHTWKIEDQYNFICTGKKGVCK